MLTCILLAGQVWISDGASAIPLDKLSGARINGDRLEIGTLTGNGLIGDPVPEGASIGDVLSEAIEPCTDAAGQN